MTFHKIGYVARELGVSSRRILEYERAGLVHPLRESKTADRLYAEEHIAQIRAIRHLIRDKGFTLDGIRTLLEYASCWRVTDCGCAEQCPVPRCALVPCYEQRAAGAAIPQCADCTSCPIYQRSTGHAPAVVMPPPKEHAAWRHAAP